MKRQHSIRLLSAALICIAAWVGLSSIRPALAQTQGKGKQKSSAPAVKDKAREPKSAGNRKADLPAPPQSAPAPTTPQAPLQPPEPEDDQKLERAEDLPLLPELLANLPPAASLLKDPPVDWIVLSTNKDRVLFVEPVSPRPHTIETMKAAIEKFNQTKQRVTGEQLEEQRKQFAALHYLKVLLVESAVEDYQIHIDNIAEIIHHEDLMLKRANALIDTKQINEAVELLFALDSRHPDWPGTAEAHQRLLFTEAEQKRAAGQFEAALVSLEDLFARNRKFNGLSGKLGEVVSQLLQQALAEQDYQRTRHFLRRLSALEGQHPVAVEWTTKLQTDANEKLNAAREAFAAQQYDKSARIIEQAVRVWPDTAGLTDEFRRILNRYPRLHVGVLRFAGELTAFPLESAADAREASLAQAPLFEVDRIDTVAHYRSPFLEEWEPTDLGRKVHFSLRPKWPAWETRPHWDAPTLATAFAARMNVDSSEFDERFAMFLNSVRVRSPFELEVGFTQVPWKAESLFTFPINPGDSETVGERFVRTEQTDSAITYRRARPQSESTGNPPAEVIEHRYASSDKMLQALLRGDVSMLRTSDPAMLGALAADGRFFVQQTALPVTHVLQFRPTSPLMKSRELRRGLAYSIDAEQILRTKILQNNNSQAGRRISAPFATQLSGYDSLVVPHKYQPALAAQLVIAARKLLGGNLPPLKMVCTPEPETIAAATEFVKGWSAIGVPVTLVADNEPASDDWDIAYRTLSMSEPATQLWPFLTLQPQARVQDLVHLPDWLRQELLDLEMAGETTTVVALLKQLHAHLQSQVHMIPLWEVDEFVVLRKNITGFADRPVSTYQYVDRWSIQPWYPVDAP